MPREAVQYPGPVLDGIQRLSLQAHPGVTADEMVRWEGMNLKKFKLNTLQKLLTRTIFLTDSPLEVIRVCDSLQLSTQMAHSECCAFFPDIDTLTPQFRFRDLLPPETYQSFHDAYSYYLAVAKTIRVWITYPSVMASAPLIKRSVETQVASCENDSLTIFMSALRATLPHLGSSNIDFTSLVSQLILENGDDIFTFLNKAQKVETLCTRCRIIIPANGLIKRVLFQLHRSTVVHHQTIISPRVIEFNAHVRKMTESVIFYGCTVSSLTNELRDAKVPTLAVIDESADIQLQESSIFDDTPAPTILDLYDKDDEDDGYERVAHLRSQSAHRSQPSTLSNEAIHQLHALRAIIDKKKQRGYLKSTTGESKAPAATKVVCKFCTGPHDTEACMQRGEAFWPEEKRKRAKRFNLVHGETPKAAESVKEPSVPPKATFLTTPKTALKTEDDMGTPQVRFMADASLEEDIAAMVKDLDDAVEEGIDFDELEQHVIQAPALYNMSTSADVEDTLFHALDSSTDDSYEIPEGQVNF